MLMSVAFVWKLLSTEIYTPKVKCSTTDPANGSFHTGNDEKRGVGISNVTYINRHNMQSYAEGEMLSVLSLVCQNQKAVKKTSKPQKAPF